MPSCVCITINNLQKQAPPTYAYSSQLCWRFIPYPAATGRAIKLPLSQRQQSRLKQTAVPGNCLIAPVAAGGMTGSTVYASFLQQLGATVVSSGLKLQRVGICLDPVNGILLKITIEEGIVVTVIPAWPGVVRGHKV